ncbi:MAG: KAP family NTPase [Rickettsiales bacterium]|jgi:hypothetical protein|nr:KAP family NTPase [Rickettsiales bacterium]
MNLSVKSNRQEPVSSCGDDRLNRVNFVNYVANIIESSPVGDRSFVLSINGKWGEGKTSVKNMVMERLFDTNGTNSSALVEFSGIGFQTQSDLSKIFLKKIIDTVRGRERKRTLLEAARRNKGTILYVCLFLLLLSGIIYPNMIVRSSSLLLSIVFIFKTQFKKITISTLMDVVSRSLLKIDLIHKILYYNELEERDVENAKLIRYLKTKNPYDKIVVFVDNFDSLGPQQIQMLAQLINSNLNLPKLVFVLFYDKLVVENCLTTSFCKGSELIERFVNIQLDLPLVNEDVLLTFLQEELQSGYGLNVEFIEAFRYVRNYFPSLTKIYSFLDNFNLNYALVFNNNRYSGFSLNRKDFLFLEILRFFENDLYRVIRTKKRILTKHNFRTSAEDEEIWSVFSGKIKNNSEENIRGLLFDIFPYLAVKLGFDDIDYDENRLISGRSVGYFDYFNYYFMYDLNESVVPERDFCTLVNHMCNNGEFVGGFVNIGEDNLQPIAENVLHRLFRRVDDIGVFNKKLSVDEIKNILKNIIWLYSRGNRSINSKKYVIAILEQLHRSAGIDDIINSLRTILEEKDYSNYFYTLELLNMVKGIFAEPIFWQKQKEVEKYKKTIDKVTLKYVSSVLEDDKILAYLSKDTFASKLQMQHLIKFMRSGGFTASHTIRSFMTKYISSTKFGAIKEKVFGEYFGLLYSFVEFSVKKKIINGSLHLFLDDDSLYPFDIEEVVRAFERKKISRKDRVLEVLVNSIKKI